MKIRPLKIWPLKIWVLKTASELVLFKPLECHAERGAGAPWYDS